MSQLQYFSSLIFLILNLVRSEEYDIQCPSHTLKFHDELKDKEVSYYELKELQKMLGANSQMISIVGQSFVNQYGPEEMVSEIRDLLVKEVQILSFFNGQFANSKQGPKSAENLHTHRD